LDSSFGCAVACRIGNIGPGAVLVVSCGLELDVKMGGMGAQVRVIRTRYCLRDVVLAVAVDVHLSSSLIDFIPFEYKGEGDYHLFCYPLHATILLRLFIV
jgi:hypothetical protein